MTPWGFQMRNSRSGRLGTCRGHAALGEGAGLRLPIVSHQSAEVPTTQAIFKTWKRKGQGLYPVAEDEDTQRHQQVPRSTAPGSPAARNPTAGPRTPPRCVQLHRVMGWLCLRPSQPTLGGCDPSSDSVWPQGRLHTRAVTAVPSALHPAPSSPFPRVQAASSPSPWHRAYAVPHLATQVFPTSPTM